MASTRRAEARAWCSPMATRRISRGTTRRLQPYDLDTGEVGHADGFDGGGARETGRSVASPDGALVAASCSPSTRRSTVGWSRSMRPRPTPEQLQPVPVDGWVESVAFHRGRDKTHAVGRRSGHERATHRSRYEHRIDDCDAARGHGDGRPDNDLCSHHRRHRLRRRYARRIGALLRYRHHRSCTALRRGAEPSSAQLIPSDHDDAHRRSARDRARYVSTMGRSYGSTTNRTCASTSSPFRSRNTFYAGTPSAVSPTAT